MTKTREAWHRWGRAGSRKNHCRERGEGRGEVGGRVHKQLPSHRTRSACADRTLRPAHGSTALPDRMQLSIPQRTQCRALQNRPSHDPQNAGRSNAPHGAWQQLPLTSTQLTYHCSPGKLPEKLNQQIIPDKRTLTLKTLRIKTLTAVTLMTDHGYTDYPVRTQ